MIEILRGRLRAWVPADNFYLGLYDPVHNEVQLPLLMEGGRAREVAPVVAGGLLQHVLQTRRALQLSGDINAQCAELGLAISPSAHQPLRWAAEPGEPMAGHSYLAVPILLGEANLGVLAVEAEGDTRPFSERDERLLSTIAGQAALVIDRSRLDEQARQALAAAQERLAQLEALTAALGVIASTQYSEDVIGVALDQFQRVIPFDQAALWRREIVAGPGRQTRWTAVRASGHRESIEALSQQAAGSGPLAAVFAEILSTRRSVTVADTAQDTRFASAGEPLLLRTRSWLGVPLVNKGEVIGLLVAEKVEPDYFQSGARPTAQILVNQITAVLTNSSQYEETVQRVLELDERSRRLAFLNRFSTELSAGLDLRHILQLTLKALAESLGVDQATAAVFDETRGAANSLGGIVALEHYPDVLHTVAGRLALPGNSLIERLQETPTPITVEDVSAPETPARLRQADWIGQEIRAAMFLPLVTNGKLIGLIGLGQNLASRHFTPAETELGLALADLAGVAAQNARLYDRTQQRLAEQSSINQISRTLGRSLDSRELYATLREQIEAWVGVDQLYLALYDEAHNQVSFPLAVEGGQPVQLEPRTPTGLLRHLLQRPEPVRLNTSETVAQQLKALGLSESGLGAAGATHSLDDPMTYTALLGVPLVSAEHVVGAMLLAGPRRVELFDESHERILSAVAAQVAAALGQARQFEQTRQMGLATQARAAQLSVLSEAATVIASAVRTDEVLQLSLDQLQRVIPYDSARLWRREAGQARAAWRLVAERGTPDPSQAQLGQSYDLAMPEDDPVAEILSTRGSLVIPDARRDARFDRRSAPPGSWLGAPLIYQGDVLGLIAIEKTEPNAYSPALAPLAQAFAHQAAVSLGNVRQYEESVRRAFEHDERSALLNRVSAALSRALEPHEVLATTLAALAEALQTSRAAAILFEESRGATRVHATARHPASGDENTHPLPLTANLLLDQLRENLAPTSAGDVAADSLILPEYTAWIGPEVKSALFLPLSVAGKLIGLVGLGYSEARRTVAASEIELATTLCNQAAIAAHNARLYQETQRRLTELAAINQSSRAISQTIDLKQLFEAVRAQLESNLRADSYYVALYDEAKDEVIYPLAIEHGEAQALAPRRPDRLIRHILESRQPLLLTGDIGARLAEMGLHAAGDETNGESALVRAKSYLGVPLLLGTQVTGVLAVEDNQRAFAFTERHERTAMTIAAPIAAAVDAARLYEESAERAQALDSRAALLGRLAAELGEATSLKSIVAFIAQVAAETLMVDVGAALVLDEAQEAQLPLASARYPEDRGTRRPAFIAAGNPLITQLQNALTPMSLDDLSRDPQTRADLTAWLGRDVSNAIFLPLVTADKLIGLVAAAQTGPSRQFTAGEVDLAMSLANQAAVAAANARLQERMQPRLRELAAISRISRAINFAGSQTQLFDTIAAEVAQALETQSLVLALLDPASQAVSFPIVLEGGQRLTASPQAPAGALGYIIEKGSPLLLNGDIPAELEKLGVNYQPLLAGGSPPKSYLGVPLVLNGRPVGALVVEDEAEVGKFTQSHEVILTTVAAPIAVALENARLQTERESRTRGLAERTRQLALLNRLSAGLMGGLDVDAILRLTLDELCGGLPADRAGALLLKPEGGAARLVVSPAAGEHGQPDEAALAGLLAALNGAGGPVAVADVATDERVTTGHAAWLGGEAHRLLLAPMRADGRTDGPLTGLVLLARTRAGQPFSASEIELAGTSVNQAAMAIEGAELAQAAQQARLLAESQSGQLSALSAVSQDLAGVKSSSAALATTLSGLARALPYDSLVFYEYLPGADGAPENGRAAGQLRVIGNGGKLGAADQVGQTIDLGDQTYLAEILRGRRPVVIADAQAEARLRTTPVARAWMGVPVFHGEQTVGLIAIAKAEAGFYQSGHAAVAQTIAGQMASALDNARQLQATQQLAGTVQAESRRVALLNRITDDIFRTLELHDILRRALTSLVEVAGVEQGAALIFGDAGAIQPGPTLVQYPAQNTAAALPPAGSSLFERWQAGGPREPVVVADANAERIKPAQLAWIGREAKAAVLLPLMAGEEWFGVVALAQGTPRTFAESELALLQDLAGHLAVAANNARLHLRTETELQEQLALNRLSQALSRVSDPAQFQAVMTPEMSALLGVNTWYLALRSANGGEVAFAALVENGQDRPVKPLAPEGVIGHILEYRQPLLLTGDINARLKTMDLSHRGSRAKREAGDPSASKAFLGVPVLAGDSLLGVLAIEHASEPEAFGEQHTRRLQALAEQVALALERLRREAEAEQARLLAQEQRQRYDQAAAQAETQSAAAAAADERARAQMLQQAEAQRQWAARLAGMIENRKSLPAPMPLQTRLNQELLLGSRALGADAGAVYLQPAGSSQLAQRADYGLAEALPAGLDGAGGLVGAALRSGAPIVAGDLASDPRWLGGPHSADDPGAPASGSNGGPNGASNGGVHNEGESPIVPLGTGEPGQPTNGYYRSALVVPLPAGEQPLGVLLFLSSKADAFDQSSLPLASAAASQVALAVQAEARDEAWRSEAETLAQIVAGTPAAEIRPVEVPAGGADVTLVRAPVQPVEVEPARRTVELPAEPEVVRRGGEPEPSAQPAWRRLALPAAGLLVMLCLAGAAIANAGAIQRAAAGLLGGGAATATQASTAAPTAAATFSPNQPATSVPATSIVLPTNTSAPATATATVPPTNTPAPTDTAAPTGTATEPLPFDVIGVAQVVLADGVVGRVRDAPNGNVISGITNGTIVHILRGRQTTDDGIVWVQIRRPDTGAGGWVSESLLQYIATPTP